MPHPTIFQLYIMAAGYSYGPTHKSALFVSR